MESFKKVIFLEVLTYSSLNLDSSYIVLFLVMLARFGDGRVGLTECRSFTLVKSGSPRSLSGQTIGWKFVI